MSRGPMPAVVLFVEDVERVAAFYRDVAAMMVIHQEPTHVVLEVAQVQLVIHALTPLPDGGGSDAAPPTVREDSYWKFCLPVQSIATARDIAAARGGRIKPVDAEWEARGFRACDGHDPEGNVLQVREPAA